LIVRVYSFVLLAGVICCMLVFVFVVVWLTLCLRSVVAYFFDCVAVFWVGFGFGICVCFFGLALFVVIYVV